MSLPSEWENTEPESGSDGIARNLAEWYEYIISIIDERFNPPDDSLEGQIERARHEVGCFFQCEGNFIAADTDFPNLKSFTGDAAQEYFRLAIKNAYETGNDDAARLDRLKHHMRSFADRLSSSLKKPNQTLSVGQALMSYIEACGELPSQPSELAKFTREHEKWERDGIPARTIREALSHYKLENIIRGNTPG